MAEGALGKLVTWGLLIIFLLLFAFAFFNPKFGLIQKVAKIGLGAEKFLPDEPKKEVTQDQSLPSSAITAQERFVNELSQHNEQSNCLLEFTDVSGLEDTRLEILNYEGGMSISIEKTAGKEETGTIKLNPLPVNNNQLKVCTINAESFYRCAIDKEQSQCSAFTSVNSISLSKDSLKIENSQYPYAKGLLFKPQKDRICFIPLHSYTGGSWYKFWESFTRYGCDATKATLDEDCAQDIQINIKKCGEKASVLSTDEVHYNGDYYETKDKWKYEEVSFFKWIIFCSEDITKNCNNHWVYTGNNEKVPGKFKTRGISAEHKVKIFGPPARE